MFIGLGQITSPLCKMGQWCLSHHYLLNSLSRQNSEQSSILCPPTFNHISTVSSSHVPVIFQFYPHHFIPSIPFLVQASITLHPDGCCSFLLGLPASSKTQIWSHHSPTNQQTNLPLASFLTRDSVQFNNHILNISQMPETPHLANKRPTRAIDWTKLRIKCKGAGQHPLTKYILLLMYMYSGIFFTDKRKEKKIIH